MCFNPFSGSCWSPFGFKTQTKKSNLQDGAVDVEFQEVKETPNEEPKINKDARFEQIFTAAEDFAKELSEKSPVQGLLYMMVFTHSVNWADEHPRSSFESGSSWMSALQVELKDLLTGLHGTEKPDSTLDLLVTCMFFNGVLWAKGHPATTL